jgi:hypothetical protein
MLSKPVFEGDRVIVEDTYAKSKSTYPAIIKRLGHDNIFVDCPDCSMVEKVQFREIGVGKKYAGWILWNTLADYEDAKKRDRLIKKIKQTAESWHFGNELATEDLEAIAELIEVKQC